MARSIGCAVRGASGMLTTLPPLRVMVSVPVSASHSHGLDVGAGGLGDPQGVMASKRNQRVAR